MKKERFILFLFGIFLIYSSFLCCAIVTDIKTEYRPLETMILKIDGNFVNKINQGDVFFYSDRIFIPMIYDITKIGDSYYLYAILPNNERNYTLVLKDISYFEEGKEEEGDLEFNFSVKGNVSSFTVSPGFIITNKDFYLKVISNNKEIKVKSSFEKESKETTIIAGGEKNILFSIKDITQNGTKKIILEADGMRYEVPALIFFSNEEEVIEEEENIILFYPENETVYMQANSEILKKVYVLNNGSQDIKDLEITLSPELKSIVSFVPLRIELLEAGNFTILDLVIKSKAEEVSGKVNVGNSFYFASFPLSIKITGNQTLINKSSSVLRSCSELEGEICESNEACLIEKVPTIESTNIATCCVGGCKKLESDEESGGGKGIILFIVIALLLIIVFFVYKKFKTKGKTPEKVMRERTSKYEERFKSEEVRGNLKKY